MSIMAGSALTVSEREIIAECLIIDRCCSWAKIARHVGAGRSPTTIAREVERNGGRDRYRPASAQDHCEHQRRRPRARRLEPDDQHRPRIINELRLGRSPWAIRADLHAEGATGMPCVETIYQAVYDRRLDLKPGECLRSRRPRRQTRQHRHRTKRGAGLPSIGDRLDEVNDRSVPGHWEADHIIGAHNRSAMLWLTERVTRYGIGVTMPEGYSANAVLAGLVEACDQIPTHLLRSITFDQGGEWAEWETLANEYKIDAWFCDPHAPWQRGQIKNQNRAWRWWFPRGTDPSTVTPQQVDHAAKIINGQRRRNLNNQSPGLPKRKKFKRSDSNRYTTDDLVNRQFDRDGPNQLWMTDITEYPTREGRVSLMIDPELL